MTGPFAGAPPQVGRATARTSVFAGYAGGIVSAAVDGIRVAEAIAKG